MISQSKRSCTAIFSPNGCIAALVRCIAALVRYHTHKSSHLREEKKKWNRFFSKCGEITKRICQNDIEPGFIDRQWWWKREFRRDSGVGVSEYRCTWYRLRCTSSSKNVWGVVVLVVRVGGWLPYGNPSNCGKALLCSSSIISDFLEYRYVSLKWRRYGGWKITSLKSSSCWL